MVDGGRGCLLQGAAAAAGPAVALGGQVVQEVADVAAGDEGGFRPLVFPGIPLQVAEHHTVVLDSAGRAVMA